MTCDVQIVQYPSGVVTRTISGEKARQMELAICLATGMPLSNRYKWIDVAERRERLGNRLIPTPFNFFIGLLKLAVFQNQPRTKGGNNFAM